MGAFAFVVASLKEMTEHKNLQHCKLIPRLRDYITSGFFVMTMQGCHELYKQAQVQQVTEAQHESADHSDLISNLEVSQVSYV